MEPSQSPPKTSNTCTWLCHLDLLRLCLPTSSSKVLPTLEFRNYSEWQNLEYKQAGWATLQQAVVQPGSLVFQCLSFGSNKETGRGKGSL
jgi:hypothetical protein